MTLYNFSYCLVTFKAAIHYLMTTDFADIIEAISTRQTATPTKPKKLSVTEPVSPFDKETWSVEKQKSPRFERAAAGRNSKTRFEQEMETINKLVEDSTKGLGATSKKTAPPVSSIFGGKILSQCQTLCLS